MTIQQEASLALLDAKILSAQLYAQLWIARGSAYAKDNSKIGSGYVNTEFDPIFAFKTAVQHIERIERIAENKQKVILGQLNEQIP